MITVFNINNIGSLCFGRNDILNDDINNNAYILFYEKRKNGEKYDKINIINSKKDDSYKFTNNIKNNNKEEHFNNIDNINNKVNIYPFNNSDIEEDEILQNYYSNNLF